MARKLTALRDAVNAELPGYHAEVSQEHVNKDGKMGRLRIPRKGCVGNRLVVVHVASRIEVYRHQAGEAYRRNEEVEEWLTNMKRVVEAGFEPTSFYALQKALRELNGRDPQD